MQTKSAICFTGNAASLLRAGITRSTSDNVPSTPSRHAIVWYNTVALTFRATSFMLGKCNNLVVASFPICSPIKHECHLHYVLPVVKSRKYGRIVWQDSSWLNRYRVHLQAAYVTRWRHQIRKRSAHSTLCHAVVCLLNFLFRYAFVFSSS
jgi:hypothetical protein